MLTLDFYLLNSYLSTPPSWSGELLGFSDSL